MRRWKPQDGTRAPPKAKYRWCAPGHQDPDIGKLETYVPTPQMYTIMLFLLVLQSLGMDLAVADCKMPSVNTRS